MPVTATVLWNSTTSLITHRYPLGLIMDAYQLFENREDGVIKVAICTD